MKSKHSNTGEDQLSLKELTNKAFQHLKDQGYSKGTLDKYGWVWRKLTAFAGDEKFSRDLIERFVNKTVVKKKRKGSKKPVEYSSSSVSILIALHFLIRYDSQGYVRYNQRKVIIPLPKNFQDILTSFEEYCVRVRGYRPETLRNKMRNARQLLLFIADNFGTHLTNIQASLLTQFLNKHSHYSQSSMVNLVTDIRVFLRYLWSFGYLARDFSTCLPRIHIYRDRHIPVVLSSNEVASILSAIDRGSPMGKRDYAILLLASRLGLRSKDIRELRLDDLHWAQSKIAITQSKTGKPLVLPIMNDVGEAVIDYLRHGRPESNYREVFLWARPPFKPLGKSALCGIIKLYKKRTNITPPSFMHGGMHVLRYSLATQMQKHHIPLKLIADVLGHESIESTKIYTKIDITALRSATLNPDDLFSKEVVDHA